MRMLGFIAGALATGLVVWISGMDLTTPDTRAGGAGSSPAPESFDVSAAGQHGSPESRVVPIEDYTGPGDGADDTGGARREPIGGAARAVGDSPVVEGQESTPPADSANARGFVAEDDAATVGGEAAGSRALPTEPDAVAEDIRETGLASVSASEPVSATVPTPKSAIELATRVAADAADTVTDSATADQAEWLGFFTPFRSEASARGFAQHLEAATGRQFRVTRAGPGDYRVEFRLVQAEDRSQRIAEIEAASGLALRAGQL